MKKTRATLPKAHPKTKAELQRERELLIASKRISTIMKLKTNPGVSEFVPAAIVFDRKSRSDVTVWDAEYYQHCAQLRKGQFVEIKLTNTITQRYRIRSKPTEHHEPHIDRNGTTRNYFLYIPLEDVDGKNPWTLKIKVPSDRLSLRQVLLQKLVEKGILD